MKNLLKKINRIDLLIHQQTRDKNLLSGFSNNPKTDPQIKMMHNNIRNLCKRKYCLLENLELLINKEKANISYKEREFNSSL